MHVVMLHVPWPQSAGLRPFSSSHLSSEMAEEHVLGLTDGTCLTAGRLLMSVGQGAGPCSEQKEMPTDHFSCEGIFLSSPLLLHIGRGVLLSLCFRTSPVKGFVHTISNNWARLEGLAQVSHSNSLCAQNSHMKFKPPVKSL